MPSTPWQQVVEQIGEEYLKGAEDLTMRNRFLLSELKRRGRISNKTGGLDIRWKAEVSETEADWVGGLEDLAYAPDQPFVGYDLDWKQVRRTNLIHRKERAIVAGPAVIVSRYREIIPRLVKEVRNAVCEAIYIDGYASGNEAKLTGLRSCLGHTAASTDDADKIAYPSDTYGGLSTELGNRGGTWSAGLTTKPNIAVATDWPFGSGDAEYDFNTPKLVRDTSTSWSHATKDFANNATQILRFARAALHNTNGGEVADLCVLDESKFTEFKDKQEGRFSINLPQFKGSEDTGFQGHVLNFEGMTMSSDFDCPAGYAFILQPEDLELVVLNSEGQKGMFYQDGPRFDPHTDAWLYQVGMIGQMKLSPKSIAATYAFTDAD